MKDKLENNNIKNETNQSGTEALKSMEINDSVIGQKDKIKSVVARQSLVLAEGVVIYGFAGCEYGGKTTYRVTFK